MIKLEKSPRFLSLPLSDQIRLWLLWGEELCFTCNYERLREELETEDFFLKIYDSTHGPVIITSLWHHPEDLLSLWDDSNKWISYFPQLPSNEQNCEIKIVRAYQE